MQWLCTQALTGSAVIYLYTKLLCSVTQYGCRQHARILKLYCISQDTMQLWLNSSGACLAVEGLEAALHTRSAWAYSYIRNCCALLLRAMLDAVLPVLAIRWDANTFGARPDGSCALRGVLEYVVCTSCCIEVAFKLLSRCGVECGTDMA